MAVLPTLTCSSKLTNLTPAYCYAASVAWHQALYIDVLCRIGIYTVFTPAATASSAFLATYIAS